MITENGAPTGRDGSMLTWAKALSAIWLFALATFLFAKWPIIKTLEPNEVGDFLAGAFAPLAFSWLVVAVFLQRDELQAQRKELEQNREALMLQASELKNSVEQLQHHTQLMREEQAARAREIREENFEHDLIGWALDCAKFARLTGGGSYHVRWDQNQQFSHRNSLIDNATSIEHFSNKTDLEKCFHEIDTAFSGLIRIATSGEIQIATSQITFDELLAEIQKLAARSIVIRETASGFTTSKAATMLAKIRFTEVQMSITEAHRFLRSNEKIRSVWHVQLV